MTTTIQDTTHGEGVSGRGGPRAAILVLSSVIIAVGAGIFATIPLLHSPLRESSPWLTVFVGALFCLAQVTVFNIEFRREAIAISVSEVPLVIALVFVAPTDALAARLIGCAVAFTLFRRLPPHKILFNLAIFTIETAIAYRLMRPLVDVGETSDTVVVLTTAAAAVVASIIGSIVIAVAISRFEGGGFQRIIDEVKSSWWSSSTGPRPE